MDRLAAMEAHVLVVDARSFSAAARRLDIGQPAVSKLVAQLEERLGVKVLVPASTIIAALTRARGARRDAGGAS